MKKTKGDWLNDAISAPEARLEFETERACFEFVEQLEHAIDRGGVSRAALARRVKKSPAYITQVLNGGRNLTLATMAELASALACELHVRLRYRGADAGPVYTEPDNTHGMEWTEPGRSDNSTGALSEASSLNVIDISSAVALRGDTSALEANEAFS